MKKFLLAVAICAAFAAGYGVVGSAYYGGRDARHGYFDNRFDDEGITVFPQDYTYRGEPEAFPSTINSANEFISFVENKLRRGDARERTGAAFMIHTMIGDGSRLRNPTTAQIREWEARIRYSERQGWITWRAKIDITINSYYQGAGPGSNPNDDAFLPQEQAGRETMLFKNASGRILYAIKWFCANPVGQDTVAALPAVANDFDMEGVSTIVPGTESPKPGDIVQFRHTVRNVGPDSTSPNAISVMTRDFISGATVVPFTNAGIFTKNQSKSVLAQNYRVPLSTLPGTNICRQVGWRPDTDAGNVEFSTRVCATVRSDFTLTPSITVYVNGKVSSTAEPGDIITFKYEVNNTGTTAAVTNCVTNGKSYTGYENTPTGLTPVADGVNCTVIPAHTKTTVGTKDVPATENTTVCRNLVVTPRSSLDPSPLASPPACAIVASKPYVKVFGGDVSVGGDFGAISGTCTTDPNAGIIAWNKRNPAGEGWAGAGTQYAAAALDTINDFTTTHDVGGADAPSGLAFSNSGVSAADEANGVFGKSYGAASCMSDYFDGANKPGVVPLAGPGISFNAPAAVTQSYKVTGNTTLDRSHIKPGQQIRLFVEGDLYIKDDITFDGPWSVATAPLFQVAVQGNIYVGPDVTRLDGVYSAQKSAVASTGVIYTCANAANPFVALALDGTLLGRCKKQLVVNGAMTADRLVLLRTYATLRDSVVTEPRASSKGAEVFNYSAANWMAQPTDTDTATNGQYDEITSLPPVL